MNERARKALSADEVRHVAKLAQLHLAEAQVEQFRTQLSSILDHVATLSELDVGDVTPMFHATDHTGHAAEDVPQPSMPVEAILELAPHVEGTYLAVPKVLAEDAGG